MASVKTHKGVLSPEATMRLGPQGMAVMRERGWMPAIAGAAGLGMVQRGSSYADNPGSGAANLVPVEQASAIISAVPKGSASLQMFRHVPMGRYQQRVPVLSVLPQAGFVNGEVNRTSGVGVGSGMKSTTYADWEGRYLQAEEIATIVPIAEALLADSEYDIWGELTPLIAEAIGRALDDAIFFGHGTPPSYPASLVNTALSVGNAVVHGTATQAQGSLANDIAKLFAPIEEVGFEVNGALARTTMRQLIRNARTTFGTELTEIDVDEWYGQPVTYPLRGLWPAAVATFLGNTTSGAKQITGISSTAPLVGQEGIEVTGAGIPAGATLVSIDSATQITLSANATATAAGVTFNEVPPIAIAGDFRQGLLGVRQDITWKVLDQAVLTDAAGNIQINLAQQDAVAIRVVARFGFAVANVVTYDQPNESARWPFAVLL